MTEDKFPPPYQIVFDKIKSKFPKDIFTFGDDFGYYFSYEGAMSSIMLESLIKIINKNGVDYCIYAVCTEKGPLLRFYLEEIC